jgi:hypothetical protein
LLEASVTPKGEDVMGDIEAGFIRIRGPVKRVRLFKDGDGLYRIPEVANKNTLEEMRDTVWKHMCYLDVEIVSLEKAICLQLVRVTTVGELNPQYADYCFSLQTEPLIDIGGSGASS